jgi:small subunit ribosomal protein S6
MKMKKELAVYESLLLLSPSLSEIEVADSHKFYKNFLIKQGSKVLVEPRGKRNLSYPIKNFTAANYVQFQFIGNASLIKRFSQEIMRDENVLRHLITNINSSV